MKRILTSLNKRSNSEHLSRAISTNTVFAKRELVAGNDSNVHFDDDSPEANAARAVVSS
jgi:hypothetical protein